MPGRANVAAIVSQSLKHNPGAWRQSRGYLHNLNQRKNHEEDYDIVLKFNNIPRYDVHVSAGPNGPETLPPGIARLLCKDINFWRKHGEFGPMRKDRSTP